MGWKSANPLIETAVAVSIIRAAGAVHHGARRRQLLAITAHPEVAPALKWWIAGTSVDAEWGEGPDAGQLRIRPSKGGPFILARPGGRPDLALAARLTLPLLRYERSRPATPVSFMASRSGVVLTMPSWWRIQRLESVFDRWAA